MIMMERYIQEGALMIRAYVLHTFMPSHREIARSGRSARRVRKARKDVI